MKLVVSLQLLAVGSAFVCSKNVACLPLHCASCCEKRASDCASGQISPNWLFRCSQCAARALRWVCRVCKVSGVVGSVGPILLTFRLIDRHRYLQNPRVQIIQTCKFSHGYVRKFVYPPASKKEKSVFSGLTHQIALVLKIPDQVVPTTPFGGRLINLCFAAPDHTHEPKAIDFHFQTVLPRKSCYALWFTPINRHRIWYPLH